jgi:hypothetical protein
VAIGNKEKQVTLTCEIGECELILKLRRKDLKIEDGKDKRSWI